MKVLFTISLLVLSAQFLSAQDWIDNNRSNPGYRKSVIMQANNVESIFNNFERIGQAGNPYSGIWPKGTKHDHLVEMTLLAAGEVTGSNGKTYHIVSESYSEYPNTAPDGHEYWWNPKPGYANENRRAVLPDGTIDTTLQIAHSADPYHMACIMAGQGCNMEWQMEQLFRDRGNGCSR